jgi:hypothetical protein
MKCGRCNYDLNFVYEDIVQAEQVLHIQEYYCPRMQELFNRNVRSRRYC